MLLSELNFGVGNNCWTENHLHIFRTLYYNIISKCIKFLLASLPYQAHLDFEQVNPSDSESRRIHHMTYMGDWWWAKQHRLPAVVTIVAVICTSDRTHLTNFSCDKHAWPLKLTIGNIHKVVCHRPKKCT